MKSLRYLAFIISVFLLPATLDASFCDYVNGKAKELYNKYVIGYNEADFKQFKTQYLQALQNGETFQKSQWPQNTAKRLALIEAISEHAGFHLQEVSELLERPAAEMTITQLREREQFLASIRDFKVKGGWFLKWPRLLSPSPVTYKQSGISTTDATRIVEYLYFATKGDKQGQWFFNDFPTDSALRTLAQQKLELAAHQRGFMGVVQALGLERDGLLDRFISLKDKYINEYKFAAATTMNLATIYLTGIPIFFPEVRFTRDIKISPAEVQAYMEGKGSEVLPKIMERIRLDIRSDFSVRWMKRVFYACIMSLTLTIISSEWGENKHFIQKALGVEKNINFIAEPGSHEKEKRDFFNAAIQDFRKNTLGISDEEYEKGDFKRYEDQLTELIDDKKNWEGSDDPPRKIFESVKNRLPPATHEYLKYFVGKYYLATVLY